MEEPVVAPFGRKRRPGGGAASLIPTRTLFAAWPALDSTWSPRNPYKRLAGKAPRDAVEGPAGALPGL